jgi:hypothetical protein
VGDGLGINDIVGNKVGDLVTVGVIEIVGCAEGNGVGNGDGIHVPMVQLEDVGSEDG